MENVSDVRKILHTKIHVSKYQQNRLILLSNCVVSGRKKLTFIKNEELSNDLFKMNKIINKFLLAGDKFMPELARVYLQCLWTIY